MRRLYCLAALLMSTAILAACTTASDRYPTLEIREAERVSGTFDVADAVEPVPMGSDTAANLPEIESAARASHKKFLEAVPSARNLIEAARGSTADSNVWAAAQIARADLESQRSETAIALAELDLKYANATMRFEQRDAVETALRRIEDMIAEEDRILSEIGAAAAQ